MATIEKVIRTEYPDSQVVLSNLRNKKGIPIFKLNDTYTASKVTTWYDGTPMNDSKADGKVYLRYKSTGEYFLVNLPNWGETFLEKNTVTELRAMSSTEILLIKIGYYKGVKLNGYYTEGDTPAPIEYYLSDTTDSDDGGSVFEVGGVKLEHDFKGNVDIRYFGAIGDRSFDNSLIFDNVLSYLSTVGNRRQIIIPRGYQGFNYSEPLVVPPNISFMGYSTVYFTGTTGVALTLGQAGLENRAEFRVSLYRSEVSDWSDPNCIGLKLINFNETKTSVIQNVWNFTKNIVCEGNGAGFAYNNIELGRINDAKYSIILDSVNGGFTNENVFNGGRFSRRSAYNVNKDIYGILITSSDGSYTNANNNRFKETSFEFLGDLFTESKEVIPIVVEVGQLNLFENIRNERNNSPLNPNVVIRTSGVSKNNKVVIGTFGGAYTPVHVQDLGQYPTTVMETMSFQTLTTPNRVSVFSENNLRQHFLGLSSDSVTIKHPNIAFCRPDQSTVNERSTDITLTKDYIVSPSHRAFSVRVNTEDYKRFNVRVAISDAVYTGVKVQLRCYDASSTIMYDSENYLVKSNSTTVFSATTRFGGCYETTNTSLRTAYFVVDSTVKYVDIIISGASTTGSKFTGLEITCLDGKAPIVPYRQMEYFRSNVIPNDTLVENGTTCADESSVKDWWIKTSSGWQTYSLMSKGAYQSDISQADLVTISTADATDEATAIALVNEIKAKYNTAVALINATKASQNTELTNQRTAGQQAT